MINELFFDLIRISLGKTSSIPPHITEKEWNEVYQMANKHAISGLILSAVDDLCQNDGFDKPDTTLVFQWIELLSIIKTRNEELNNSCRELFSFFSDGGKRCCVLKGQGLSQLYPDPSLRQSGDIDLWIEGNRANTLSFLKSKNLELGSIVIHHVDASILPGIETEIHFIPIWLYNPIYNSRLQRFFKNQQDIQFSHYDDKMGFCYPTTDFNIIYCMVHLYHHYLDEGVGFRQIIDYYYILNCDSTKSNNTIALLKHLGLYRFARALMWVIKEVCMIDDSHLLCNPDKKRGQFLLAEIMATGNLGHYDSRYSKFKHETPLLRNLRKSKRWLLLVHDYPSEIICIPFWKLWHWCWRKFKRYV